MAFVWLEKKKKKSIVIYFIFFLNLWDRTSSELLIFSSARATGIITDKNIKLLKISRTISSLTSQGISSIQFHYFINHTWKKIKMAIG